MPRALLAIAFTISLFSTSLMAQQTYLAGTDYGLIEAPVATSRSDKVVVTEIFWYGCPHCFRFEPFAEQLATNLPDGVVFEQTPSVLNPHWAIHARAHYAFKAMGALDQLHRQFFDAIHQERKRMNDIESISDFVARQGLDVDQFRAHFKSFEVDTQLRKSIKKEQRYGHRGVPAVIVNGKYLVSASQAGSNERMVQIIKFLADQELAL